MILTAHLRRDAALGGSAQSGYVWAVLLVTVGFGAHRLRR
jgi:hypothetical protein